MLVAVEGWRGGGLGRRAQQAVEGVVMLQAVVGGLPEKTNRPVANTSPLLSLSHSLCHLSHHTTLVPGQKC